MNETKPHDLDSFTEPSQPRQPPMRLTSTKKRREKRSLYFLRLRIRAMAATMMITMMATMATISVRSGTACSTIGLTTGVGLTDGEPLGATVADVVGVGETSGVT